MGNSLHNKIQLGRSSPLASRKVQAVLGGGRSAAAAGGYSHPGRGGGERFVGGGGAHGRTPGKCHAILAGGCDMLASLMFWQLLRLVAHVEQCIQETVVA